MLCELLSILYERQQSNSLYLESLCQLIALCGRPFLKEKVTDDNTHTAQVLQVLMLLGQFAAAGGDSIAATVAKAVASFYTEEPNQALMEGKSLSEQAAQMWCMI